MGVPSRRSREIPGSSAGVTVDNDGLVYIANKSEGLIYRIDATSRSNLHLRETSSGFLFDPLNSSSDGNVFLY